MTGSLEDEIRRAREQANLLAEEALVIEENSNERVKAVNERARKAKERLPDYYEEIVDRSKNTFAYAIYDCHVPAYRRGRICLAGDAGAFARPHTAAGALKSINDAIALGESIKAQDSLEEALKQWDASRTETNNKLVTYGNQLGRALVKEIPDWSTMDAKSMQSWFASIVEIPAPMQVKERAHG